MPDKDSSNVTLRVVDDRDFVKDPTLGYVTVSLNVSRAPFSACPRTRAAADPLPLNRTRTCSRPRSASRTGSRSPGPRRAASGCRPSGSRSTCPGPSTAPAPTRHPSASCASSSRRRLTSSEFPQRSAALARILADPFPALRSPRNVEGTSLSPCSRLFFALDTDPGPSARTQRYSAARATPTSESCRTETSSPGPRSSTTVRCCLASPPSLVHHPNLLPPACPDLNPAWDQYVYVPVHSLSDRPILEVMDYQHLTSACLPCPVSSTEPQCADSHSRRSPRRGPQPRKRRAPRQRARQGLGGQAHAVCLARRSDQARRHPDRRQERDQGHALLRR